MFSSLTSVSVVLVVEFVLILRGHQKFGAGLMMLQAEEEKLFNCEHLIRIVVETSRFHSPTNGDSPGFSPNQNVEPDATYGSMRWLLKGAIMKRINFRVGVALVVGVLLGVSGSRMLNAQDNLKAGTVLQRTDLKGAPGWEAILVERILPPGGESGKHTQGGNEIVYIQEGSVTFEAQGKPAVILKPGEAFTTTAGEVHNVKNASSSAPAKALAFYVAKKGTKLEDLSVPAK